MSFLDRIAAAVTPAASDESRNEARRNIDALATREPWIQPIVDQHREIEGCFREAYAAPSHEAVERLATVLTGHANAEEAVLYPDIADQSSKTHAGMAYEEHAMTKIQLAKLKDLAPGSKEWTEKLEHIESAVAQHIYQEEDSWLPHLAEEMSPERKARLQERYAEEYRRYCGTDSSAVRTGAGAAI